MQESPTPATNGQSLDEIIAELDQPYTGKLPEQAIRAAQGRKEEIAPRLIELIRSATAAVRAGERWRGDGPLLAMYLLTEFRVNDALPAIVEAMSLPGDGPYDLFGDAITEDLNRILAVLAADTPEVIDAIIANRSFDEFVRATAVATYLHWVRDDRLSRDQAVDRLREHLRTAIENEDAAVVYSIVRELAALVAVEAREEIDEAFRRDLVNLFFIDEEDVERSLARGEAGFRSELEELRPTEIADTVEVLSRGILFEREFENGLDELEATHRHLDRDGSGASFEPSASDWSDDFDDNLRVAEPIRNATPKVGRNEPCPCGSGKKFKKCCGAAQ